MRDQYKIPEGTDQGEENKSIGINSTANEISQNKTSTIDDDQVKKDNTKIREGTDQSNETKNNGIYSGA